MRSLRQSRPENCGAIIFESSKHQSERSFSYCFWICGELGSALNFCFRVLHIEISLTPALSQGERENYQLSAELYAW